MHTTLREARETLVPDLAGPHGPLPPLLLALTLVTGLVDAFSFLALGRVFVANMTGNVLFLAFSLAGAHGFSVSASALSLLSFLTGAALGGRLGNRVTAHRARLLLGAVVLQMALIAAACAAGAAIGLPAAGPGRFALIVPLGLAMGAQNAVVRRLGVPDLTTTVLTMTLTGFAAEARVAGGVTSRAGRRLLSVAALFSGALAGAALIGHGHPGAPPVLAAALLAAVGAVLAPHRRSAAGWTR